MSDLFEIAGKLSTNKKRGLWSYLKYEEIWNYLKKDFNKKLIELKSLAYKEYGENSLFNWRENQTKYQHWPAECGN